MVGVGVHIQQRRPGRAGEPGQHGGVAALAHVDDALEKVGSGMAMSTSAATTGADRD